MHPEPDTVSDSDQGPWKIQWCVDKFEHAGGDLFVEGWAFGEESAVASIELAMGDEIPRQELTRLPSADVELAHGPIAAGSRFAIRATNVNRDHVLHVGLRFRPSAGPPLSIPAEEVRAEYLQRDPMHCLFNTFFALARERAIRSLLEIGSRARSGNEYKTLIDESVQYTGLDIVAGLNVDIVGDAHELSSHVKKNSVDAIFTISTFEHLAMPWKAAIEMNRVLRTGGIAFVQSHQSWAVHEAPWDYWRFSSFAWDSLFNAATGFRVVEAAMGEPCSIVPHLVSEASLGLAEQPAYLGSAVIVEKVAKTRLKWPVKTSSIATSSYPL
jgi:Methyltransferase domain